MTGFFRRRFRRRFGGRFRRRRYGRTTMVGRTVTHRIDFDNVTIDDSTAQANGNKFGLLNSKDDPDETLVSDGTNIAECEAGSKIVRCNLTVQIKNGGPRYRIVGFKNPKNLYAVTDSIVLTPWLPATTAIRRAGHEGTWFARDFQLDSLKSDFIRVHCPRLQTRNSFMADLDQLSLFVKNYHTTTDGALYVKGTITTIKP